jgi:hypothetical protein
LDVINDTQGVVQITHTLAYKKIWGIESMGLLSSKRAI